MAIFRFRSWRWTQTRCRVKIQRIRPAENENKPASIPEVVLQPSRDSKTSRRTHSCGLGPSSSFKRRCTKIISYDTRDSSNWSFLALVVWPPLPFLSESLRHL